MSIPVPKFFFKVSFNDGMTSYGGIGFQEVTGLEQEAEHVEYRVGNDKTFMKMKRRGLFKSGQVSLKRGTIRGDYEMMEFFKGLMEGKHYYYPTSDDNYVGIKILISLCDYTGKELVSWNIANAVPIKFTNANLKSDANEIAIESIDFVHEGIEIKYH